MIIATHKEIEKGMFNDITTPHLYLERFKYTDSDLILKRGVDYEKFDKRTFEVTMCLETLELNLKYIFQDAYRKGREDTLNQLMH